MRRYFMVLSSRGPAWDDSRPMREQEGWDAHASFMDALTDERFVVLGGPLEGTRDAMLIVQAEDASALGSRTTGEPDHTSGSQRSVCCLSSITSGDGALLTPRRRIVTFH